MKPGWKTTEFWLTLLTSAWAIFGGHFSNPIAQAAVPAVLGAAYSISRGLAKTPPAQEAGQPPARP
jgi:hypothetical protein